jgi:hypothetical protein
MLVINIAGYFRSDYYDLSGIPKFSSLLLVIPIIYIGLFL